MNLKKILFVAGLAVATCFAAKAQQEVETEYVFEPHWYVQGQFGVQHTLGEIDFSDLLSPNIQVGVGYNWTSVWGARLTLNAWQSKGGYKTDAGTQYKYKWNYIAPTVDLTMNVTNLVLGYNPERKWNLGVFAGVGLNFAMNNDECNDLASKGGALYNESVNRFEYLWDDSKTRVVGQMGLNVDYKINDQWSFGVEGATNFLSDRYNSKKAGNVDWYFNVLAGVKYSFGKTYTKKTRSVVPCEPQIIEKEVIKEVIKEVVKEPERVEALRRDIFFELRGSEISTTEMTKLQEVADYLNKYPNAKVLVTGYADKGTGNARINLKYSEARAKKVAQILTDKYGISPLRIISQAKGDAEQPYAENKLNRVTICIAE